MKPHVKSDFKKEALENISEIIRQDILPLLVQGHLHQVILENPIQNLFGTGLNVVITTEIKIQPISDHEFKDKEKQTCEQNKLRNKDRGMH